MLIFFVPILPLHAISEVSMTPLTLRPDTRATYLVEFIASQDINSGERIQLTLDDEYQAPESIWANDVVLTVNERVIDMYNELAE